MESSSLTSIATLTLERLLSLATTSESTGRTWSSLASSSLAMHTLIHLFLRSCQRIIPLSPVKGSSTRLKQMILPSSSLAMMLLPLLFTHTDWSNFECCKMNQKSCHHLMETTLTVNSSFNKHPSMLCKPKQRGNCGINVCVISLLPSLLMLTNIARASLNSKVNHHAPSWISAPHVCKPSLRKFHRGSIPSKPVHPVEG